MKNWTKGNWISFFVTLGVVLDLTALVLLITAFSTAHGGYAIFWFLLSVIVSLLSAPIWWLSISADNIFSSKESKGW